MYIGLVNTRSYVYSYWTIDGEAIYRGTSCDLVIFGTTCISILIFSLLLSRK